jgi:Beta-propeller repeat
MLRVGFLTILIAQELVVAGTPPQPHSFPQPLLFEQNRGQAQAEVTWMARGPGYQLFFTRDELVISFFEKASKTACSLRLKLPGSKPWTNISGLAPTGGVSNYFQGERKPALEGVPHYARITVAGVYQGVDLTFHSSSEGKLEYDFVLQPNADVRQVQMAFAGQALMRLDQKSGELVLRTASGFELRQARPTVYQPSGSGRKFVAANYRLLDNGRAGFRLGEYDHGQPLIIDPTLNFALLREHGYANAVTADQDGNLYVTGGAYQGYPTTTGSQWLQACPPHSFFGFVACYGSIFVTKVSPTGAILFSTFGGPGEGRGIAVDSTGVYVTGITGDPPSSFFGQTGVIDSIGTGLAILKMNLTGGVLYLHGFGDSYSVAGQGIALDSQHNAWVVGYTNQTGAGKNDVYITKFDFSTQNLIAQTLGGKNDDAGYGIAIDKQDHVWITGQTCSPEFPVTPPYYNGRGPCNVFLTEVVAMTSQSITTPFSTVFGGSTTGDSGTSIAIDAAGEVVVTGHTYSGLFPVAEGAFQRYPSGSGAQAFAAKYDESGNYLTSTLLGGNGDTFAQGVAVNGSGEVYVSGYTTSTIFPGGAMVLGQLYNTAGFLSKFSSDLTALEYTLQVGDQSWSVITFEELPTVTPTRVHPTGLVWNPGNQQYYAYVDRIDDDNQLSRLRNYWQPDLYINTESGVPTASEIQPDWWSAQWEFDIQPFVQGDPAPSKVFWIHNRWKPNEYLNVESGNLQSTPIQPDWLSARWSLEQIQGTNLYRIRNVWQPTKCLNIESGTLTASEAGPGWWSSYWSFERVF